ncbi:hypothetical protein [Dehalococcoides mccartyi]|uniref:hypothetical protein n=1 Tax=Dehalococcoides mccartyi TaxID=61435 RepID=UPI001A0BCF74|nr:hypothetical protein [Dehalococcoides mccartyi]MBF4483104.1 hypothetical protein [Dehalococcoides mccartyi]MBJ7531431.1 hypothetical protein [Dehalococcoides mccartyi]
MVIRLAPTRGGFLRPFGCGWFIREFLLGNGPEGSTKIDPKRGAPQADINFEYKEALARATARERAERIISNVVVNGADVSEEEAEIIYQRELKRVSRKFTHMRYHSFLMYFGVLKRLGWVETTNRTEASAIQDNYPSAPERTYYKLTKAGIEADEELWQNPLFTLYPQIGPSHMKKPI